MHCLLVVLPILLFVVGCESQNFPSASGCTTIKATIVVAKGSTYDGKNKCLVADNVLGKGNQAEGQRAIISVEEGGSVANVVFGANAADGIHCKGSCNIKNVWWTDVGEDAATFRGGANTKVVVDGGGAKSASDKTFQHNGGGSVSIKNFLCQDCGKLYRSCGVMSAEEVPKKCECGECQDDQPQDSCNHHKFQLWRYCYHQKLTIVGGKGKPICERSQGNNSGKEPTLLGSGLDGKNCIYKESDVIYQ